MATGGSILVIRGGAIGDFILTLPALRALREAFPKARLTVLGYPHIAELAVAGGLADEARPIEARPMTAFFTSNGRLPEELAAFFGGFDVILSYLYDPDAIFERNVRRCSAAQWIRGPHRPSAESGAHAAECFLKPLERLAVFDADPTPRLRLPPAPSAAPGPALAAHPGSGSPRKNWPAARWAELLEAWPAERLEPARNLSLVELGRRLAACEAFVGHDSGITHLAAALGLPALALWGETDPAVWRPRGEHARILRWPEGLERLPVEPVRQALLDLLAGSEYAQLAE